MSKTQQMGVFQQPVTNEKYGGLGLRKGGKDAAKEPGSTVISKNPT